MSDADFSDLVYEAEQLATEFEGSGELPKIERSLRQVLEASQTLWSRVTATGPQDIQANLLLGTKGLDLPQVTQKLQTLSARKTFEPLDPIPITDIQSFLKNERENAILQLIDSTHHATFHDVEQLHIKKIREEWRDHKMNLMNSLLGYSNKIMDVPARVEKSIMNDTLFGAQSTLTHEEMAYAKCLMEYYNGLFEGNSNHNLLDMFVHTASSFNNQKLSEMWKMLSCMTRLPPKGKSDVLKVRGLPEIQERMVHLALEYLEQRYREYMNSVVSGNLNAARRGGVPGTYSLVRGFVGVKVLGEPDLEETNIDGLPLWPLVYYCLRCGDVAAALQCVRACNSGVEEISQILEDLKDSPSRRVSIEMEMKARTTYRRLVHTSHDPYKRAVYCLLGAYDIHDNHRSVCTTADDYLWMKLWQLREEEPDQMSDRLHYSFLQSLVLDEYGETHYKAQEQPHVYFMVLVLTGQWESAIDFLVRVDKYKSHAVHMAIALNELNLLALPASINAPLLAIDEMDKAPMRRLNLLRLVLLYTRKFESSDPKETLYYYYSLRNLQTTSEESAFTACVSSLVLETKMFDLILGKAEMDGCLVPGLLQIFSSSRVDPRAITEHIAQIAESKGQYEDAIRLYDLCGVQEKVLTLLNSQLSQVVSKSPGETNTTRSRLIKMSSNIYARYMGIELNCKSTTMSTFLILKELINFFDMYHMKEFNKALDILQGLRLVPMSLNEVEERVTNFRALDETVCRNMPDILLATMHIYHHQYLQMQTDITSGGSILEDPTKTDQLNYVREKASLISSFAGTIPYRMPGDTNSRLVQLEIMMN